MGANSSQPVAGGSASGSASASASSPAAAASARAPAPATPTPATPRPHHHNHHNHHSHQPQVDELVASQQLRREMSAKRSHGSSAFAKRLRDPIRDQDNSTPPTSQTGPAPASSLTTPSNSQSQWGFFNLEQHLSAINSARKPSAPRPPKPSVPATQTSVARPQPKKRRFFTNDSSESSDESSSSSSSSSSSDREDVPNKRQKAEAPHAKPAPSATLVKSSAQPEPSANENSSSSDSTSSSEDEDDVAKAQQNKIETVVPDSQVPGQVQNAVNFDSKDKEEEESGTVSSSEEESEEDSSEESEATTSSEEEEEDDEVEEKPKIAPSPIQAPNDGTIVQPDTATIDVEENTEGTPSPEQALDESTTVQPETATVEVKNIDRVPSPVQAPNESTTIQPETATSEHADHDVRAIDAGRLTKSPDHDPSVESVSNADDVEEAEQDTAINEHTEHGSGSGSGTEHESGSTEHSENPVQVQARGGNSPELDAPTSHDLEQSSEPEEIPETDDEGVQETKESSRHKSDHNQDPEVTQTPRSATGMRHLRESITSGSPVLVEGSNDTPEGQMVTRAEKELASKHYLPASNFDLKQNGPFTRDEREILRRAIQEYQHRENLDVQELVNLIQCTVPYRKHDQDSGMPNKSLEDIEEAKRGRAFWREIYEQPLLRKKLNIQLFVRRVYTDFRGGPWKPIEDDFLRELCEKYPGQWKRISDQIGNRSASECHDRWRNYLRYPNRNKKAWLPEEEASLNSAIRTVIERDGEQRAAAGMHPLANYTSNRINWQAVSEELNETRSPLQCRQKFNALKENESVEATGQPKKRRNTRKSDVSMQNTTPKQRGRPRKSEPAVDQVGTNESGSRSARGSRTRKSATKQVHDSDNQHHRNVRSSRKFHTSPDRNGNISQAAPNTLDDVSDSDDTRQHPTVESPSKANSSRKRKAGLIDTLKASSNPASPIPDKKQKRDNKQKTAKPGALPSIRRSKFKSGDVITASDEEVQ